MKPTLSLSGAFSAPLAIGMTAAAASAAAAAAAAVAITGKRMFDSGCFDGVLWFPWPRAPVRALPETVQRSGTNTSPSDAGAPDPRPRPREIAISTTTVARYGNDDMNCDGIGRLMAWAWSCRMVTAPNRYAPMTTR